MSAIINIELTEIPGFAYEKPILSWAKSEFKDILTFDIDNHSDTTLFKYAATLIEQEEKVIIYIDGKNEATSGKLLGLAETIIKNKEKCLVIMNGESKVLQKIFSLLKGNFGENLNESAIRKVISDLLI
jgi:hypothetical protein